MPYNLPDYAALQTFAQNLKRFFERKSRYNPLPYSRLRDQVKLIKINYMTLSDEIHSPAVKMTEILIPSKRLGQINCIQRLLNDLSPDSAISESAQLADRKIQTVSLSHAVMLAAVLFRYLRLDKEYNKKAASGAGFFEKARALANAAVSMVVDRSPKANCALYKTLENIIFHSDFCILDSLTITYCLEEYHNYIQHLSDEKLAKYPYIVEYPKGGKEKYLQNIKDIIDNHEIGVQQIKKELVYIELIQSIAKCLQKWNVIFHACIKDDAKFSAIQLDNLSVWLPSNITDPGLQNYLDQIIKKNFFVQQVKSHSVKTVLCELFEMNIQLTLFGACHFICQLAHQQSESQHAKENHAIFLDLFKSISIVAVDDLTEEEREVYLKDCKHGCEALKLFFNLPTIGAIFSEDILSYWGGIELLKENIDQCQKNLSDLAEIDFVMV